MTGFVAIALRSFHTWRMRLMLTLLAIAVLATAPGLAVAAEDRRQTGEPALVVAQSDGMTLSQATESVRRRTGGQVISAETRIQGNREVHHIKVLKDGKVKTHRVNGRRVR